MKAVIQRVSEASVSVDGKIVGSCKEGFMVLLGAAEGDTNKEAELLARKIANSFIYNIPNYDRQYKDLEIIASSFAQGEDRKRLLKAFDARGFN